MLVIAFLIASVFPIDFSGEQNSVQAASVKLSKTSVTLEVGSSIKLKMMGTKKEAKWSTTNKAVATVTGKGTVKAKGEGKCYIKAKVGKKIYKCKVVVVVSETEDLLQVSSNKLQTELGHTAVLTLRFSEPNGYLTFDSVEEPEKNSLHLLASQWIGTECNLYLYATKLGKYKFRIKNTVNSETETISLNVEKAADCKSFDISTLQLKVKKWSDDYTRLNIYVNDYYSDGIKFYYNRIAIDANTSVSHEFADWIYNVSFDSGVDSALSTISSNWKGAMLPLYIKGTGVGDEILRISNSKNDEYIDILISVTE